jgi:hypothetical protein
MARGRAPLLVALAAGALLLAACGSDDESLSGNWTGGIRDSLGGNGGANFNFSQSGSDLGGTWEFVFPTGSPANNGGTLAGKVQGTSIAATLASDGPCSYSMTATRTGDHLAGSYAAVDCASTQKGSFDADRR